MHGQDLINELERIHNHSLLSNEGAILVNFPTYFPFPNKEMVFMDVALLEDISLDAKKIFCSDNVIKNHRHPNKHYISLTQTSKTKRCKFGTFFVGTREDLNNKKYIAFQVFFDGVASYVGIFPVYINLTEDAPFTSISCVGDASSAKNTPISFRLTVLQPKERGCWTPHYLFTSEESMQDVSENKIQNCTLLSKKVNYSVLDGVHHTITVYRNPVILYSCTKENIGIH